MALPPEKNESCSVEERMQDTDGSATVGQHKQLQFEVSEHSQNLRSFKVIKNILEEVLKERFINIRYRDRTL